jgi:signal transduction histidine kinase/ActR/RegA family two-component response regulator
MRPTSSIARADSHLRTQEVLSRQIGLLYANSNLGIGVTILAATLLVVLQHGAVPNSIVFAWWIYMILLSVLRYSFAWRYRQTPPESRDISLWRSGFVVGVGLAGAGWGAAGIFLYPAADLPNQVFLVFVLGGMMLGAASLLAPRPEAFLAFLIPAGLVPAVRLIAEGDGTHMAMGLLAVVFTLALVITTVGIYHTVDSSLRLQIENRDLVEDLRAANQKTEALNQALELRVQERTAELEESTEQLRVEVAKREETKEELLRARKLESLGVLAGGIAHDFNNFLTVVQGSIEVVKGELDPHEPAQKFLDQAANACQRAALLSSQLLTFAKGGAPVRRPVSIAELVMEVVQLARGASPIGIDLHIAEDLRFADIDPGQIGQVLHNILLNAQQAATAGGTIEVRVENVVSTSEPDAGLCVRISIRDSGHGVPPEVLPRIFDPYFTTKQGASGLGLSTAYAIVLKHGGQISVESTPGAGTVFSIDLPASQEFPPSEPAVVSPTRNGVERLLVMDDDEVLRNLCSTVLTKLGYEVRTARDGNEAIALYEAARAAGNGFDAVLLDLTVVDGMGGMETATRLKEMDPSSKLIVSSGYSIAPVMAEFERYGFDAVIPKPWTSAEMGEVFRRVLAADRSAKTG